MPCNRAQENMKKEEASNDKKVLPKHDFLRKQQPLKGKENRKVLHAINEEKPNKDLV
jgi:hypothetical protein